MSRKIKYAFHKISDYFRGIYLALNPRNSYAVRERNELEKKLEEILARLKEERNIADEEIKKRDEVNAELERQLEEEKKKYHGLEEKLGVYQNQLDELKREYDEKKRGYEERERIQKGGIGLLKARIRNLQKGELVNRARNLMAVHKRAFIVAVGVDDGIVAASPRALKTLSYSDEGELLGKNVYDFVVNEQEVRSRVKSQLSQLLLSREEINPFSYQFFPDLLIRNTGGKNESFPVYIGPQLSVDSETGKKDYIGVIIVEQPLTDKVEDPWLWKAISRLVERKTKKSEKKVADEEVVRDSLKKVSEAYEEVLKIKQKRKSK